MTAIFSRIKFNTGQVVIMVVFALLASVAQLLAPTMVSKMIDCVSDNKEKTIIVLAVAIIILSIVACITNIISTNLAAKLTTRFSADLRREIFYKVQDFSSTEVDKFGSSSLITRTTTDVTMIQSFLVMLFRLGLLAPMMAVIGLVLSVATTGKLAVVLAIAIPILIIVVAAILTAASRYSVKLRDKIDTINRLFLEALEALLKGRTSFVIAHRLSTVRDANVILYMENGDIKEVGDHDTLMKLNGKYAVLYNRQFG